MKLKKWTCLMFAGVMALMMSFSGYADTRTEDTGKYEGSVLSEAYWDYTSGKIYARWDGEYRSKATYAVDLYQDGVFVTTKTVVGGSYVSFAPEIAGRGQTGDYKFTVRAMWPGMYLDEKQSDTIYIEDSRLEEIQKRLTHSAGSEDPGHAGEGPSQGAGSWKQTGGVWKYLTAEGIFFTGGWKLIDGKWYYFDADGTMAANRWIVKADNAHVWYYVGSDGAMVTNQQVGEWVVDANGECRV